MCHQTVGLIARELEAAGIPTTSVATTRDITRAVRPPRAAFVDFPTGNTTGKVGQPQLTRSIVTSALDLLSITEGEVIRDLDHRWSDNDDWKDEVFRPKADKSGGGAKMIDDRVERFTTPQYQTDDDARAAIASHDGEDCLVCVGIDF